ncbi:MULTISPECIES: DUF4376 domain-containing protein [unclassified Chelatococcus]|uniref:DUF4376 domain-containing protein n=1 Tax=unclassified Chelatococcus TaxID=2638111 RepID=UPI001BD0E3AA|nr:MULTISPECIES: DUF4376 domain-containing protein [unclassified Chelatococcus]MBS7737790.1 DUF4376 domain-containing protein [Chelatococcus sp. HY11]MCO5079246.1 DUF4376 domain-containing protein [Chelatococcus sp.]CAH1665899.1 hypothetical protein CHELA41_22741 [Hyphomicrobiales bacterium]CAH1681032.1 hypothetical protein CHELA20_52179 [Hyphomicrobiales bacterium]
MHALIQVGEVVVYPYTDWHLRRDNPDTSFPTAMDDTVRADFGVHPVAPTPIPTDKRAIGTTAGYVNGELVEIHTLEDIPLEELKAEKLAALAQRRWEVETGGLTVGGLFVPTDRETQAIVDRTVKAFDDGDLTAPIEFKSPAGFVELTVSQLRTIKAAGAQHIQACFKRESVLTTAIAAATTPAALDAIDINQGWPT